MIADNRYNLQKYVGVHFDQPIQIIILCLPSQTFNYNYCLEVGYL